MLLWVRTLAHITLSRDWGRRREINTDNHAFVFFLKTKQTKQRSNYET